MDGVSIEAGKSVKYLGIILDPKLNFITHVKKMAKKASIEANKIYTYTA